MFSQSVFSTLASPLGCRVIWLSTHCTYLPRFPTGSSAVLTKRIIPPKICPSLPMFPSLIEFILTPPFSRLYSTPINLSLTVDHQTLSFSYIPLPSLQLQPHPGGHYYNTISYVASVPKPSSLFPIYWWVLILFSQHIIITNNSSYFDRHSQIEGGRQIRHSRAHFSFDKSPIS